MSTQPSLDIRSTSSTTESNINTNPEISNTICETEIIASPTNLFIIKININETTSFRREQVTRLKNI